MTRLRVSEGDYPRPDGVVAGSIVSVFRVPPENAGQRLDVFLQSQLRRTSRTRTQTIIRLSAYDAGGRRLRSNHRVQEGQEVCLWRAPWDETAVPTDVPIVYEDDHLMAVDKPAHLPVHPTARYHHNTLIKLLQAARPGEFLSLGHRIDRETSGVLLVSKTPACDRALKAALEARDGIEKVYTAITWGVPRGPDGARSFRHEEPLELDAESRFKVKMRVGRTKDALYAATRFHVTGVARRGDADYALVRCELETGRQHQIRVHLLSLGAPIVGDKLYGPDESAFARSADGELTDADLAALELPRHALHATQMTLPHPITGERLVIDAALPPDLAGFWASLAAG